MTLELSRSDRTAVVGVGVDPVSMQDVIDLVLDWTETDVPHTAVGVNAAVCNLAASDPVFGALVASAELAYADGQSVVWAGRMLGVELPERVATTDLVAPLAAACARAGKRMFLFGGMPGSAALSAERLREIAPDLQVDARDGYGNAADLVTLIRDIRAFGTDVLLVGLGDPEQQRWIDAHRDEIGVPAVLSCGGLFEWTSGMRPRAPKWMQIIGLEWLWRLALEPRRLFSRYVIGNPAFVARLARQRFVQRRARTHRAEVAS